MKLSPSLTPVYTKLALLQIGGQSLEMVNFHTLDNNGVASKDQLNIRSVDSKGNTMEMFTLSKKTVDSIRTVFQETEEKKIHTLVMNSDQLRPIFLSFDGQEKMTAAKQTSFYVETFKVWFDEYYENVKTKDVTEQYISYLEKLLSLFVQPNSDSDGKLEFRKDLLAIATERLNNRPKHEKTGLPAFKNAETEVGPAPAPIIKEALKLSKTEKAKKAAKK